MHQSSLPSQISACSMETIFSCSRIGSFYSEATSTRHQSGCPTNHCTCTPGPLPSSSVTAEAYYRQAAEGLFRRKGYAGSTCW